MQQPPRPPGYLPVGIQVLLGAVLGVPVLWFLASLPGILLSALISAVGIGDEVGATAGAVWGFSALVGLAAIVAGVVYKHTRWYVVGAVIGSAVLLIVLAGVCIAFIAALAGSH